LVVKKESKVPPVASGQCQFQRARRSPQRTQATQGRQNQKAGRSGIEAADPLRVWMSQRTRPYERVLNVQKGIAKVGKLSKNRWPCHPQSWLYLWIQPCWRRAISFCLAKDTVRSKRRPGQSSRSACGAHEFDLILLGQSMSPSLKHDMYDFATKYCSTSKVAELYLHAQSIPTKYSFDARVSGPEELLEFVKRVLADQ